MEKLKTVLPVILEPVILELDKPCEIFQVWIIGKSSTENPIVGAPVCRPFSICPERDLKWGAEKGLTQQK